MDHLCLTIVLASCATANVPDPVVVDPGEAGTTGSGSGAVDVIPDVRCSGTPDAGPAAGFDHLTSSVIALGTPKHRGYDLVAPASAGTQTVEGWISYTIADKALEDERVDVFACRLQQWQAIGSTRTDGEGHFALELSAADRMPIGMRDLYVSVVGDRTGAEFLGYVAPDNSSLVVADIDGTLTASENAFLTSLASGDPVGVQADAGAELAALADHHAQIVYVSARGNQYTDVTRSWFEMNGLPRGPLRLAASFVTLPGGETVEFKTGAMATLSGFDLIAGIGNRATDVQAYAAAGIPADRIFVKLPEYSSELAPDLSANHAIGFQSYVELRTTFIDQLP